jgi:BirA family biotin operon repressor/biotin-[acetyl-CoA-carboxylase] ligase
MTADDGRKPLDVAELNAVVVSPDSMWRRVDVVAETGSTNADLIARRVRGEDVAGAVLIAENQTAGRGRNGRSWSTVPRSQIIMSVGVPAGDLPVASWGWVPLVTGMAVVDAVAEVAGIVTRLKWPNDVLADRDGHKLAGILAEVSASVIVVGIGLNVSLQATELPESTATSLGLLGATDVDRVRLIGALLRHLRWRIEDLKSVGGADDALIREYTTRSRTISSRVRATLPGDREVIGDARSVDDQGRLHIDTGTTTVVVSAGDIVHLRPV